MKHTEDSQMKKASLELSKRRAVEQAIPIMGFPRITASGRLDLKVEVLTWDGADDDAKLIPDPKGKGDGFGRLLIRVRMGHRYLGFWARVGESTVIQAGEVRHDDW